jgi:hypothetical protein
MLTCYVSERISRREKPCGQVVREWVNLSRRWRRTTVLPQQEYSKNSTSFRKAIDFVRVNFIFFIIETLLEQIRVLIGKYRVYVFCCLQVFIVISSTIILSL